MARGRGGSHLPAPVLMGRAVARGGWAVAKRMAARAAWLWPLAAGCALGPGMRMDEGALVSRAEREGHKPSAVLIPVTPDVVRQLREADATHAALAPDPLAESARRYE